MKILSTAIEQAAAIAMPQIAAKLEEAADVLKAASGEALTLGEAYANRIASFVALAVDGTLSADIATKAIEREIAALEELGLGIKEKAVAEAFATAKEILKVVAKVGISLVIAAV